MSDPSFAPSFEPSFHPSRHPTSIPTQLPDNILDFHYLPWVILMLSVEISLCIYFLIREFKKRYLKYNNPNFKYGNEGVSQLLLQTSNAEDGNSNSSQGSAISAVPLSAIIPYVFYCNFDRTFTGLKYKNHKGSMFSLDDEFSYFSSEVFLLIFRFICFSYFIGVSSLWNLEREEWLNFYFFTTWNACLLGIYYLLAFICSCIGMKAKYGGDALRNTNIEWSPRLKVFGNVVHILFEVCGATCVFVTIVAFTLLNPEFTFWNMSLHFFTSCSMLVEMALNSFYVDPIHIIFNLLWAGLFCCFIWPYVYYGGDIYTGGNHHHKSKWPYPFLYTGDASSFYWYSAMIVGNFAVYFGVWWSLYQLKKRLRPEIRYDFALIKTEKDSSSNFDNKHIYGNM